ncbi:MAG: Nif3-like dinuclear metal center hexameric protein, partial [Clostridia bacterium]|nr:Nif3-like dinuclear metal center hexameric protein [Clostridia bacterium]
FLNLSSLTPFDPTANRLLTLVREDIAVFSFHTRFDGVKGGVNDVLAALLGLSRVSPLGTGEAAMARVGDLPSPLSFSAFVQKVKATLDVPFVVGKDTGRPITKVALCGGEGKDFIPDALKAGADVYLSGRLGYHAMQDAPLSLLEAGHYYTERPSVNALASLVNEICGAETETLCLNPLQIY